MLTATKKIWKYQAEKAAWYFVSFSKDEVVESLLNAKSTPKGWGQIPVIVTIGNTSWKTSLFPSKTRGYDLPIKAAVRRTEQLSESSSTGIRIITL